MNVCFDTRNNFDIKIMELFRFTNFSWSFTKITLTFYGCLLALRSILKTWSEGKAQGDRNSSV